MKQSEGEDLNVVQSVTKTHSMLITFTVFFICLFVFVSTAYTLSKL